jgi:hypothetical protein
VNTHANEAMGDKVATQAYFDSHPEAARQDIIDQATAANMSLNEYCRVLMSFDAIRSVCIQYIGIGISVIMHQQTGEVIMREATAILDEIWDKNCDATDGADVMAARIIQASAQMLDKRLEDFLKLSKNTRTN